MGRQPGRRIERHAAIPELKIETSRLVPLGDDFANSLTGNYARAFANVKPRQPGHQHMISLAPINDQ